MSSPISNLLFTDETLIVVLEDGLLAEYDIDDSLTAIGVVEGMGKTLTRRNTLGAVFNVMDKPLIGKIPLLNVIKPQPLTSRRRERRYHTECPYDLSPHPQVTSVGFEARCMAFNEECLFITKQGLLLGCKLDSVLKSESFSVSFVSLLSRKPQHMADSQLQFLLDQGEIVTDAHMVMAHAWPLYIVGTSKGRVFVVPLSSVHAIRCLDSGTPDPVSCLLYYHNSLISCSYGGTVQCWSLSVQDLKGEEEDETSTGSSFSSDSGQKIDMSPHFPISTFTIPYNKVVALRQPHYIREVLEGVPEAQWREKWNYWQRLLIGQLDDETVILLSMEAKEVLCAFYGLRGGVKEALVHLLLDYLFLNCGDGDCYIVNMCTQQLERIIPSIETPYRTFRHTSQASPLVQEAPGEQKSPQHQILDNCMLGLGVHHSQALAWVEYPSLGKSQFPVLCLNVGKIADSFREMVEFPEQAQFIISLLNSWVKTDDEEEMKLQKELQMLFRVHDPSVIANIGTLGVENALSFRLPTSASRWEVSSYVSAILSTSVLSLLSACTHFKPSLKPLLAKSIESHVARLNRRLREFKRPSLAVLGYEVICGSVVAYELLKTTLQVYAFDERKEMMEDWNNVFAATIVCYDLNSGFDSPGSPSLILNWRSGQPMKLITQSEALSALLLCVLNLSGIEYSATGELVATLGQMLKNANEGFVMCATLLLHDGVKKWKGNMNKEMFEEITASLLKLHYVGGLSVRNLAKKAALSLGKADVVSFCDVLKHEIVKISGNRDYPESILSIIEAFIHKHAAQILHFLPHVLDVILRSLDTREILLRKICLSKATDALEVMVKRLPMVAFEHNRQLLAVGTSDNRILIYDLKTATLWRELKGHGGPVNAICFNPEGNLLVSYCITDEVLKEWTIEQSFLGFGSLQVSESKEIPLTHITPLVKSSRELLSTISIAWKDKEGVELTREDGVAYVFPG